MFTFFLQENNDQTKVDFHVRTAFLIGQTKDENVQNQIRTESRMHDDLIQENFMDSYNNLTLKTAMMFKWINNNCIKKGIHSVRLHIIRYFH